MRKLPSILMLSAALGLLSGCLYRPDMSQGNIFSNEQVAAIHDGMTREQVRTILGTPAVTDPFHPNEDNYVFIFRSGETNRTYSRNLNITYQNDMVTSKNVTPLKITK